jgi:hypothetical protein
LAAEAKATPAFVALFDYTASEADELSFKVGDTIAVSSQDDDDGDWWRGTCKGATGVFPANYVKPKLDIIDEAEEPLTQADAVESPLEPHHLEVTNPSHIRDTAEHEHTFADGLRSEEHASTVPREHERHRQHVEQLHDRAATTIQCGHRSRAARAKVSEVRKRREDVAAIAAAEAHDHNEELLQSSKPPPKRRTTYAQGSHYDPFKGHAHDPSHHGAQKHHAHLQEEVHHQETVASSAIVAAQARNRGETVEAYEEPPAHAHAPGSHFSPFHTKAHERSHHGEQTHQHRAHLPQQGYGNYGEEPPPQYRPANSHAAQAGPSSGPPPTDAQPRHNHAAHNPTSNPQGPRSIDSARSPPSPQPPPLPQAEQELPCLTAERERELTELFEEFDCNHNGYIEASELADMSFDLGGRLTEAEAQELIDDVDPNGDGLIDLDEFLYMMEWAEWQVEGMMTLVADGDGERVVTRYGQDFSSGFAKLVRDKGAMAKDKFSALVAVENKRSASKVENKRLGVAALRKEKQLEAEAAALAARNQKKSEVAGMVRAAAEAKAAARAAAIEREDLHTRERNEQQEAERARRAQRRQKAHVNGPPPGGRCR